MPNAHGSQKTVSDAPELDLYMVVYAMCLLDIEYRSIQSVLSVLFEFIYLFKILNSVSSPFFSPITSPHHLYISSMHSSFISDQKGTDLPRVFTQHIISDYNKTKHLPCIKARQGNIV